MAALGLVLLALLPCASAYDGGIYFKYFGFGSNLAASVREGRRGLRPVTQKPGVVREHRLAFNVGAGFGPEPAFASLARAPGESCHGAVFELETLDWLRLCASEGVGSPLGYRLVEVPVQLYDGSTVRAYTLSAGLLRLPADAAPSERYLTLIRDGARELGLADEWLEQLDAIEPSSGWVGSAGGGRRRASGWADQDVVQI